MTAAEPQEDEMTKIEWTDKAWNPLRGCSRVSEGCRNCYAEKVAFRFSGPGMPYEGLAARHPSGEGRWTGEVRLIEDALDKPLRWRKPRRVFVNSMSDLFHESVPDEWIDRVFAVMALAPRHTFQCLTKRPERMREYMTALEPERLVQRADRDWGNEAGPHVANWIGGWSRPKSAPDDGNPCDGTRARWPLPNVWLGVSVEDQATADERIPLLLDTPAAVRFVSAEPLLGPVDFGLAHGVPVYREAATVREYAMPERRLIRERPGRGWVRHDGNMQPWLDWLIVGGESGPGARPCDVAWVRSIRDQCAVAGTACFVKQLGARPHDTDALRRHYDEHPEDNRLIEGELSDDDVDALYRGIGAAWVSLRDRKGGDWTEWPADLRVREFPERRTR